MSQENLPKIIKTIFILDKNRRYAFDVNQNITIRNVKKMIKAAASLGRAHLRIFHDGIEYTSKDEETLEFLFPTLEIIIFDLGISAESIDVYDDIISLKLNKEYCPLHFSKYPYFYCYTCGKSICSECVFSKAHNGHDYKEKYDYLQSGQELVSQLFKDLNDNIKGADDKYILELKDKIRIQFFSRLKKMVEEIERKLFEVLDEFIKRNKKNIEIVKNNMVSLREHCGEGLDELKDKICIEDMMLDEEIFLTFDKKFKDIASEKNKIIKDIEEYKQFKEQLKIIADSVEKIYNEIYSFLDKYLTSDIYMKIMKEIDKIDIVPLSKKDIFYRILSDVKKRPKNYRSSKKKLSHFRSDEDKMNIENNLANTSNTPYLANTSNIKVKDSTKKITTTNILNDSNIYVLDTKYVCQPIEKTKTILVYNVNDKKVYTHKFESNLFISEIPTSCAWINYNNHLYISGGEINGKISKNLIRYDPEINKFDLLTLIPDSKECHSMCFDENDNLYLIGGLNNTVLKYNITKQKWTIFKNKLLAQRNHPICLVKDNDLYIFFGSDIYGGYVSSYERTNIGGNGKFILYNPEQKINLEFASTFETVDNKIMFFGGRNENGPLKTCWRFNLNNQTFEISPYSLNEPSSFHQCFLSEIGNNCFGYFSLENKDFVKLNFNYSN
jgi:hypothetical protein